jgi:Alkylmercury lyase
MLPPSEGSCPIDLEAIRLKVYCNFAATGQPGTVDELAGQMGSTRPDLEAALQHLEDQRHLVLDASGEVVLAHPFASIPLGFSVMGSATLWWGGCAWDSFALPHLLEDETDVLVATRCPSCDAAIAWVVNDRCAPSGDAAAHFLVPAAHIWDDVLRTCAHQRLFCNPDCIDRWLDTTGNVRGYVLDFATLWRLASRWYEGRLTYGYARRDPATAASYFAEVGLRGAFWGLPEAS